MYIKCVVIYIDFQASGSKSSKRKRGSKKKMEGRTTITSLHPDGEPKSPKFRENIPISFKLWKKTKSTDNDAEIVPDTEKEMLWADVKRYFSFPEDKEEIFKDWVMRKMAIAF